MGHVGHGSTVWWVTWVTKDDPLPSLRRRTLNQKQQLLFTITNCHWHCAVSLRQHGFLVVFSKTTLLLLPGSKSLVVWCLARNVCDCVRKQETVQNYNMNTYLKYNKHIRQQKMLYAVIIVCSSPYDTFTRYVIRHQCVSDLHSVWWSWRHGVDQFAARLSETCRTALLMTALLLSAVPAVRRFCHTPFSHCEHWRPVFGSKHDGAEVHWAAQSLAQWSAQVKTSVSWWPTKHWPCHLRPLQHTDKIVWYNIWWQYDSVKKFMTDKYSISKCKL